MVNILEMSFGNKDRVVFSHEDTVIRSISPGVDETFGLDSGREIFIEKLDDFIQLKISGNFESRKKKLVFGLGQAIGPLNRFGRRYESECTDDYLHTPDKRKTYGAHNYFMENVFGRGVCGLYVNTFSKVSYDFASGGEQAFSIVIHGKHVQLFWIEAEQFSSVSNAYMQIIGESFFPPKWAFGYHMSRWGVKGSDDVRNSLRCFSKYQIPLSVIHLDIEYMDKHKIFTKCPVHFSDFDQLGREVKSANVRLVALIDPGQSIDGNLPFYRRMKRERLFVSKPDGESFEPFVWPGKCVLVDFANRKASEAWSEEIHQFSGDEISGYVNDMNEPVIFFTEESIHRMKESIEEFEKEEIKDGSVFMRLTDGLSSIQNSPEDYSAMVMTTENEERIPFPEIRNAYGYLMARATAMGLDTSGNYQENKSLNSSGLYYGELPDKLHIAQNEERIEYGIGKTKEEVFPRERQEKNEEKNEEKFFGEGNFAPQSRVFQLSRASVIGSHRFAGVWTGDNHAWYDHIKLSIRQVISLSLTGFQYSGPDVGGFSGECSADLAVKWHAAAVFFPLMRNHSSKFSNRREPWRWGKNTLEKLTAIIRVRHRFIPHLLSTYKKSLVHKNPNISHPWLCFEGTQADEMFDRYSEEMMVGCDILYKPVCEPRACGTWVYLGRRSWYLLTSDVEGRLSAREFVTTERNWVEWPNLGICFFVRPGSVLFVDGSSDLMNIESEESCFEFWCFLNEQDKAEGNHYFEQRIDSVSGHLMSGWLSFGVGIEPPSLPGEIEDVYDFKIEANRHQVRIKMGVQNFKNPPNMRMKIHVVDKNLVISTQDIKFDAQIIKKV